jgi:hypothetical protein
MHQVMTLAAHSTCAGALHVWYRYCERDVVHVSIRYGQTPTSLIVACMSPSYRQEYVGTDWSYGCEALLVRSQRESIVLMAANLQPYRFKSTFGYFATTLEDYGECSIPVCEPIRCYFLFLFPLER